MGMKKQVLTGIKPTGRIHLGNYIGAIKPALGLAENQSYNTAYFVADYHGLTKIHDPIEMKELSYGVAAAWLALGLNTDSAIFYRQSDVSEIFELSWILSCFAPKGLLNRSHAYKSMVEDNQNGGREVDSGVNMGVFTYPILMAADILLFQTELVPVGKDQIQHVEIARDIAESFNKQYGETFVLPEYVIQEETSVLPGLDGRKMSKSYNNTIPLFEEPNKLRKLINKIKTDSSLPEEPKDPDSSDIFSLYKEFASSEQTEIMRKKFHSGIGWGEAKAELFSVMNSFMKEPRDRYNELLSDTEAIDQILQNGAEKARKQIIPFMREIKQKIGLYH
ncbi:tryptophanyl-tRNA synthetase [Bacillus sp. es.034]|nr:tryptophanyl-tRNA synthetase [Bacillus sp. es.034]